MHCLKFIISAAGSPHPPGPNCKSIARSNRQIAMRLKLPTFPRAPFVGMMLSLIAGSSASDTCALIDRFPWIGTKNQSFFGVEMLRACNILPCGLVPVDVFGFDLCPVCEAIERSLGIPPEVELPPQEPFLNIIANDMLYFNYEIPAALVPVLEATLQGAVGFVDNGFRLSPIDLLRDSEPKYYMSVNFFSTEIAGVINYRSEWSTYVVREGDSKPRFMVLQVYSSEDTADPLSPGFTNPATNVQYSIDDSGTVTAVTDDFQATFTLPAEGDGESGQTSSAWAEANDALYYLNGVADTALYNGALTKTDLVLVDPGSVDIGASSTWAAFISDPSQPDNVVYYPKPLDFAFTPYFNLYDPTLGLDPAYVGALQQYKTFAFGIYSYGHAFLVLQGQAEPLLRFDVLDNPVPSVFINFEIPRAKLKALEAELALPEGFTLEKTKATPNQPARHLLSLNIYESPDPVAGLPAFRAEWSVYVKDRNEPASGGPYFMVIDVDSSSPSLDPFNGPTPATGFTYVDNGGTLSGSIEYLNTTEKFSFSFDLPAADEPLVELHERWILANDRVYWRNGVYDHLLYNGLLLDGDAAEVDPQSATINDSTKWAAFIDPTPTQVLVFRNPLQFGINPWYNVEELCPMGTCGDATNAESCRKTQGCVWTGKDKCEVDEGLAFLKSKVESAVPIKEQHKASSAATTISKGWLVMAFGAFWYVMS